MKHSVDAEVARLLAGAVAPSLRLPRSVAELQLALLDTRDERMSHDEMALLRRAGHLGPVVRIDFEDRLLGGASVGDLTEFLKQAAVEVAEDLQERYGADGGEAARILAESGGR